MFKNFKEKTRLEKFKIITVSQIILFFITIGYIALYFYIALQNIDIVGLTSHSQWYDIPLTLILFALLLLFAIVSVYRLVLLSKMQGLILLLSVSFLFLLFSLKLYELGTFFQIIHYIVLGICILGIISTHFPQKNDDEKEKTQK